MSVNGLGSISRERDNVRTNNLPLELQRDRIHNVHVQGDQQSNGALVPAEIKRQSYTIRLLSRKYTAMAARTHHKAVAAKHIVLPTYMGSRSTLKGKPSTR